MMMTTTKVTRTRMRGEQEGETNRRRMARAEGVEAGVVGVEMTRKKNSCFQGWVRTTTKSKDSARIRLEDDGTCRADLGRVGCQIPVDANPGGRSSLGLRACCRCLGMIEPGGSCLV